MEEIHSAPVLYGDYLFAIGISLLVSIAAIPTIFFIRKMGYNRRTSFLLAIMIIPSVAVFFFSLPQTLYYLSLRHEFVNHLLMNTHYFANTCLANFPYLLGLVGVGSLVIIGNRVLGGRLSLWLSRAKPLSPDNVPELHSMLKGLASKFDVNTPKLYYIDSTAATMFVVGNKNSHLVTSVRLLEILNAKELETCMAHELAHVKNNDGLIKSIANGLKFVNIFNPVAHFAEAKIFQDREFMADELAAKKTRRPLDLAIALIKIGEASKSIQSSRGLLGHAIFGIPSRFCLLTKHPSLSERIERLIELSKVLEDR